MKSNKDLLPDYPKTLHLPWKPNAQKNDLVVSKEEANIIFNNPNVVVEEKIDGANCGICYYKEHPVIRNRSSFISKGQNKTRNAAKMQFASIYNWFYNNIHKFINIRSFLDFEISIYGEWMYAMHGVAYDKLPDLFIAYDIYDFNKRVFIDPLIARGYLEEAGFAVVPLLYKGKIEDWEQLENFCKENSKFSNKDLREGIYIKLGDGEKLTHRFKMVRQGFIQGAHWSNQKITRNELTI